MSEEGPHLSMVEMPFDFDSGGDELAVVDESVLFEVDLLQ